MRINMLKQQLPPEIMKQAVKGICYIAHPLRLRILEFLDVNGEASVSQITKAVNTEQMIVSQSLKKFRDAGLVTTKRHGIFIYYRIQEEYPASIFDCLRKLYGYMTDSIRFLADGYKAVLPPDYTTMAANRIKLFANYDKMRILEFLLLNGESNVTQIVQETQSDQLKVSQYLRRLKDDEFVTCRRDGRFVYYNITKGVHKTALQCIHKRYEKIGRLI